jgi:hypothetical protein
LAIWFLKIQKIPLAKKQEIHIFEEMAVRQTLVGLEIEDLTEIINACKGAIVAGNVRGTSYTIAGRSFTFPSMMECQNTLQEALYAKGLLTGARSEQVRVNFNPSLGRGSL